MSKKNNSKKIDPKRKDFLVFGKPLIGKEEMDEVMDSLQSGWLGTGPKALKFEEMFRKYIGAKYAVALNSCTAGLHLALLANGIGAGDEVITTPLTFCATANVIIHAGAKPIFVDINRETMNIDADKIEAKITKRTKAIIPVHFAGRPCDMDKIMKIARKHKLIVIEDAAHAIESAHKGKKIGNIGNITCFSFYVTKNIVTGEGGMITTNSKDLADKIKIYALHGMDKDAWKRYSDKGFKHYQVVYPGFKYNMMDIQAAIGIHQLKKIEKYSKRREKIWKKYNEAFKNFPVITPKNPEKGTRHAYHLYTLLIDKDKAGINRDVFQDLLFHENIGTGIHFTALHLHDHYQKTFGFKKGDFPNAEYISDRTISLPLSAALSDEDVEDVISAITKILKQKNGK
jgi:dTDP-4-amino-4,6-dideoxygalactose transaminase